MKRILSLLMAFAVIFASFGAMSVCAASDDDWRISADANYITHAGKTYKYIEMPSYSFMDYYGDVEYNGDYTNKRLAFEDDEARKYFGNSDVYLTGTDLDNYIVQVSIWIDSNYVEDAYYVEESYYDTVVAMSKGEADTFFTINDYNAGDGVTITAKEFEEIKKAEKKMYGKELLDMGNFYYGFFAVDESVGFQYLLGMIYWDRYDGGNMYILMHPENSDNMDIYGFAQPEVREEYTVYEIKDEELRARMADSFEEEPEDELDWAVADEVSIPWAMIFCSVVFGGFALTGAAFGTIMLIVVKDRKYHRGFVVTLIGSALLLIALVVILALII